MYYPLLNQLKELQSREMLPTLFKGKFSLRRMRTSVTDQ